MPISVSVIADSINPSGANRVTTLECKFHRFLLPEFNTHRAFSRNSASSRAIPMKRMIKMVEEDPAVPIFWGKNQPGMQAQEELSPSDKEKAQAIWHEARRNAITSARQFEVIGLHKQLGSRILEPFSWTTVIVTATDFNNFFALRLEGGAQPEMQHLAREMYRKIRASTPRKIAAGEWHLPYVTEVESALHGLEIALKLSAARCARVSYLNHDGSSPDVAKDIAMHDRLLASKHMSPFEHQARADQDPVVSGNFIGFTQYRKTIPGEVSLEIPSELTSWYEDPSQSNSM